MQLPILPASSDVACARPALGGGSVEFSFAISAYSCPSVQVQLIPDMSRFVRPVSIVSGEYGTDGAYQHAQLIRGAGRGMRCLQFRRQCEWL